MAIWPAVSVRPTACECLVAGLLCEHFVADEGLFGGGARVESQCERIGVGVQGDGDRLDAALPTNDDRAAACALEAADDRVVFYFGRFDVRPRDGLQAVFFLEFAAARRATQDRDDIRRPVWREARRRPHAAAMRRAV